MNGRPESPCPGGDITHLDMIPGLPARVGRPKAQPRLRRGASRPVAVIGVFDGVHCGHRTLLARARAEADRRGAHVVAVTFWPHPESVITSKPPGLVATLEEKASLLRRAGADDVVALRFTRKAADLSPEEFFDRTLMGALDPQVVVVGFNFSFGRGGRGGPGLLASLARGRGVEAVIHPPVRIGETVVSSSGVREALRTGDVERAGVLLGRPPSLAGVVERGEGRGRSLGFPTANVGLHPDMALPARGVYVCSLSRGWELFPPEAARQPSVANLGLRPTFTSPGDGEGRPGLEAHVLGGEPPSYGETVRVFLLGRLRSERKFASPEELAGQIASDSSAALAYFGLGGRTGTDLPGSMEPCGSRRDCRGG